MFPRRESAARVIVLAVIISMCAVVGALVLGTAAESASAQLDVEVDTTPTAVAEAEAEADADTTPPEVSADCGESLVERGPYITVTAPVTIVLRGAAVDADSEIVSQFWRSSDGVDEPQGTELEVSVEDLGYHYFAFIAYDAAGNSNGLVCTLLVQPPIDPVATVVPTSTPTPTAQVLAPSIVAVPVVEADPVPVAPTPTATLLPLALTDGPDEVLAATVGTDQQSSDQLGEDAASSDGVAVPAPGSTDEVLPPEQPTAAPEPTPSPDATTVPEPTAVPDATPVPTAAPDSAATPRPEATPSSLPDPEPTSDAELAPVDLAAAIVEAERLASEKPGVAPGTLEARWPERAVVGTTFTFQVTLDGRDWRKPENEAMFGGQDSVIVPPDEGGIQGIDYAVYAEVGKDKVKLLLEFDEAFWELRRGTAEQAVSFQRDARSPETTWDLVPTKSGPTRLRLSSPSALKAIVSSPQQDAQLGALDATDLGLELTIDIEAENRDFWLTPAPWQVLPLLALPFAPVVDLQIATRRRPKRAPKGAGGRVDLRGSGDGGASAQTDSALIFSGGGLRASAFALGVAMYVTDVLGWDRVGQIASVSGGSLTNAFIGATRNSHSADPHAAEQLAPFAEQIAHQGVPMERSGKIFAASLLLGWALIIATVWWAAPSFLWAFPVFVVVAAGYGLVSWLVFVWLGVRPSLSRWIPRMIGCDVDTDLRNFAVTPEPSIMHVFTSSTSRSERVHLSQHRALLDPGRENPHGGDNAHHTGAPQAITVAEAVQASAAFPGLPRIVVDSEAAGFVNYPGKLTLRDGGTIDNLGHIRGTLAGDEDHAMFDEWLTLGNAITNWVVVDCSAKRADNSGGGSALLSRLTEALHLGFAVDTAEMATASSQERTGETAAAIIDHFDTQGGGIYVSLHRSPVDYCMQVLHSGRANPSTATPTELPTNTELGQAAARLSMGAAEVAAPASLSPIQQSAFAALQRLSDADFGDTALTWRTRDQSTSAVPTTLSSLGEDTTADLMLHGYAAAAVQAAVALGWALPSAKQLSIARFVAMAKGNAVIPEFGRQTASPSTQMASASPTG